MKQAYISLVLTVPGNHDAAISLKDLERIDSLLNEQSRMHEIVLIGPDAPFDWTKGWRDWSPNAEVTGPVSYVLDMDETASVEDIMIEGMSRCVGDFVLEWEGNWALLTDLWVMSGRAGLVDGRQG